MQTFVPQVKTPEDTPFKPLASPRQWPRLGRSVNSVPCFSRALRACRGSVLAGTGRSRGLVCCVGRVAFSHGCVPVRLWPSSPNLNAYAERFMLSIRTECLDRIVPMSEAHVRRSISEYLRHYHAEQNHQGLGNVPIEGAPSPANTNGRVERRRSGSVGSSTFTPERRRE